jgi:hypothetical protein
MCSERFFVLGDDTPDNCCQLPRGHVGCHVTAMSAGSGGYACSISWGMAEPVKPWQLVALEAANC